MKHYTVDLAETASVKTEFYPSGVIEGNLKFNTCRDIERNIQLLPCFVRAVCLTINPHIKYLNVSAVVSLNHSVRTVYIPISEVHITKKNYIDFLISNLNTGPDLYIYTIFFPQQSEFRIFIHDLFFSFFEIPSQEREKK